MDILAGVWDSACAGDRQAVFVGGEPGVGKSRIVGETATACHRDGALVLSGSNQQSGGYPFQPVSEMLDHLFGYDDGSWREGLDQASLGTLSLLTTSLPSDLQPRRSPDDPGVVSTAFVRLVHLLTEATPVVLVVEDLQWAGPQTLQLFEQLILRVKNARLLVLSTARTTAPDRSHDLTQTLAKLFGVPGVARLDLEGLSTTEILHYLLMAGTIRADDVHAAATVLRDRTGGNPLFLEETLREMRRRPRATPNHRDAPSPVSILEMLALRLETMDRSRVQILECAAVAGRVVDTKLLSEMGAAPVAVLEAVDGGVEFGFLVDSPNGVQFRHELARQAVLEGMPRARRAELHAKVANISRQRASDTPGTWASLAFHYEQAAPLGYSDHAIHFLTLLAGAATRTSAHMEAADAYLRAAQLSVGQAATELRFAAAESLYNAGALVSARHLYLDLSQTADPLQLTRAAIGLEEASFEDSPDPRIAIDLLVNATTHLPEDSPWRVKALGSLSRALNLGGALEEARRVGRVAIHHARRASDDTTLAHVLETVIHRVPRVDELLPQRELADELMDLTTDGGRPMTRALALGLTTYLSYRLGDWRGFTAPGPEVNDMSESSGIPGVALAGGCYELSCLYMDGKFAEAKVVADRIYGLASRYLNTQAEGVYSTQMFMLSRATGDLHRMPSALMNVAIERATWKPGLLALCTELRMVDRTAALLPEVVDICVATPPETAQWSTIIVYACEAAAFVGDSRQASRLRELLEPFGGTNLIGGHLLAPYGSADRYLGYLNHALGGAAAIEHFEKALEMDREMRSPVHEAETLLAYAGHVDSIGGRRYAERLRSQGQAICRRIGLHRSIPNAPDVATTPLHSHRLSSREVEVLRLLALGMTNRQISEELAISVNTVANHVRNILTKTGAGNRTQAALIAGQLGWA